MIGEAKPASRVLEKGVGLLLQALPPLCHPVVPDVLGLEVLVDGEEDWIVRSSHACCHICLATNSIPGFRLF